MRYRVDWDPACFQQLDEIIEAGMPTGRIRHAVLVVEEELSQDPQTKGAEISEGLRKLDIISVRVYFHVEEPNAAVIVDGILWTNRPH